MRVLCIFYSFKRLTSTFGSNSYCSRANTNLQILKSKSLNKFSFTCPIICKFSYYYNQFFFLFLTTQVSCEYKIKNKVNSKHPSMAPPLATWRLSQSLEIISLVSDWVDRVTRFPFFQLYLQRKLMVNLDSLWQISSCLLHEVWTEYQAEMRRLA